MPRRKKPDSVPASLVPASDGARFSPTGLSLDRDLSLEEWKQLGAMILGAERGVQWWVGDWVNYGQARYGEKYREAIDATGRDYQTLANFAWVASRFEISRRREELSWSHHAEVAALEASEADRFLEAAEQEGLSVRGIRAAVQGLRHELPSGEPRKELDVPELNRQIAAQVARVRQLAGLSQRGFAEEVFGAATQQGTVSRMERGKQRPNLATLERMAESFDVPLSSFGVNEGAALPAKLVQRAAQEALEALAAGKVERAKAVLERLSTALTEEDLPG